MACEDPRNASKQKWFKEFLKNAQELSTHRARVQETEKLQKKTKKTKNYKKTTKEAGEGNRKVIEDGSNHLGACNAKPRNGFPQFP